jgi:tetratricopeptide (TPR) repeat protein
MHDRMHKQFVNLLIVAALAACLTSNADHAVFARGSGGGGGGGAGGGSHPGGGGGSSGGGGFHGGGGGGGSGASSGASHPSFSAAPHNSGATGNVGAVGGNTAHSSTFSNNAGTFSHNANTGSTFNSSAGNNHTPTFTHPTNVSPSHSFNSTGSHATNFSSGVHTTNSFSGNHFQANHSNFQANHSAVQGNRFSAAHGNQMVINHGGNTQVINAHAYNHTYIGNQSIRLAGAGYHPSYYAHSWYHGPWGGNAWGWGWGLGGGFGYGLGGFGWGIGIGSGWGYGGLGYGGYGGYGPYGMYGYWGRPLGWGFGGWGLGMMAYNSGYYPYNNPYYYSGAGQMGGYNYANPIPVATNVDAGPGPAVAAVDDSGPPPTPQSDNPAFDAARTAFREANYDAALANVDAAISKTPTDSVFHEFRALTLFAMQDYKQAAGVVHSLLAVGPGWDWTTMSSLYADPDVYTQQLRALEQYVLANPKAADAHFLLAYEYTVIGHSDAAANQLQQVVKLMPSDRLAGELLRMVQGPPKQDTQATPPGPEIAATAVSSTTPEQPQPDPIDKDKLPGSWSASRPDGSSFALNLTDDGKFTWKFSVPKQKGDEFSGTYTTDGPVLILQRDGGGGGALPGVVTFDGDGKFNFRMVGAPPEDKGLDFGKS